MNLIRVVGYDDIWQAQIDTGLIGTAILNIASNYLSRFFLIKLTLTKNIHRLFYRVAIILLTCS